MHNKPRTRSIEALEPRILLTTYYVSPAGSDAAAGTTTPAAFATLQHAANLVAAGDTVDVLPGTYTQGFVLGYDNPQNGTPTAPITFHAEPGTIITGRNNKTPDAINLEGASYIVIEGFTITNPAAAITRAGIRSVTNDHVIIRNNNIDGMGTWGIFTAFSDDILIDANTASHSQTQHGIYVSNSSQRPVIRGNTLFGNNSCGLHMNGDVSQGGVGVIIGALVEDNIIYDNGAGAGGSAINCDGVQNSRFQNNLIYNQHASGISLYQIDAAHPSTGNVIVNNTIIIAPDGRWCVNIQDASTGNLVYNNILLNQNPSHGSIDISTDSRNGFTSDYNAVMDRFTPDDNNFQSLAQWRTTTAQDAHSFIATEAQFFTNSSTHDFTLSTTSPAIDAGASAASPNQPPTTDAPQRPPTGNGLRPRRIRIHSTRNPHHPSPTVTPAPTSQQKVAADKTKLATDLSARLSALASDRKAITTAITAGRLTLATDRRAIAAARKTPANLPAAIQQLTADTTTLKNSLIHLRATLSADILHWNQLLQSDRLTLHNDLKLLALTHHAV